MKIKASIPDTTSNLKKYIAERIDFINKNKEYLILFEKNKKFKVKELIFTGTHLVVKTECGKIKDYDLELTRVVRNLKIQISIQKINILDLAFETDIEGMITASVWENNLNLLYLTNLETAYFK